MDTKTVIALVCGGVFLVIYLLGCYLNRRTLYVLHKPDTPASSGEELDADEAEEQERRAW
jgi:hypothetical protein